MTRYILGPEFLWIVIYVLARILTKFNKAPNHVLDNFIEQCWFYVPLISITIFGLYWSPFLEKDWLWLRIWISGIIMGHFVLETLLQSYSQQGPGIGMGYLAGMLLLFLVLIIGSVIVKLVF